jgi:citrate lyase beta subunit
MGRMPARVPRSLLFAPGIEPRKLAKAVLTPADMVVADLEDSVPPAEKAAARDHVARFCTEPATGPTRAVRINALDGPDAARDLDLLARIRPAAVIVPKAEASSLATLRLNWDPLVIAIVETPRGLQTCSMIAEVPHVGALLLGGVDLTDALRLHPRPDGLELLFARSRLVVDCAAAGIAAPLDGVYVRLDDPAGLQAEAELVRTLGFGGKAAIHPSQLDTLNRVFGVSEEDVAWARRVLAAYAEASAAGRGALRLDGAMVDLPVVKRAEGVLAAAGETGTAVQSP